MIAYAGRYLITIAALMALYIVLSAKFDGLRNEEIESLSWDYKIALTFSVLIFLGAPFMFLGGPGFLITLAIFGREMWKRR
jgi:hypothetical protein